MELQELSEFSDEKLIKEEVSAKILMATFIVSIVVMTAASIYFFLKKGFSPINLAVLLFTPTGLGLWKKYQAIKKELARRRS